MQKLLCLAAAAALMASATTSAQSLAETARKEKQRQARERARHGEAKVHTDSGAPAKPAEVAGSSPSADASPTPQAASRNTGARPRPEAPKEVASARSNRSVSVTLYVTSWCPYCRRAREFLARQPNVLVTIHDVEANRDRHKEMLAKTGGQTGVPVIDVEGMILAGYRAEAITEALAQARRR